MKVPSSRPLELGFDIVNKKVVLVDDVLYTGSGPQEPQSNATLSIGRPRAIRLAILHPTAHRELPSRADYIGKKSIPDRSERACLGAYTAVRRHYGRRALRRMSI